MRNSRRGRNTIAVDFDGTIVHDLKDITIKDPSLYMPKDGVKDVFTWLMQEGYYVVIFSSRDKDDFGLVRKCLVDNDIPFDQIYLNEKPRARVYIDDKALTFSNWSNIQDKLTLELGINKNTQQPYDLYEQSLREEKLSLIDETKTKTIIDIGCGDASMWRAVRGMYEIVGVDTDPNARRRAQVFLGYNAVFPSILSAAYKEYDLATCFGVLEHVENVEAFLDDFSNFKNILFSVPNAKSFHRVVGSELNLLDSFYQLNSVDLLVGHKRYYDQKMFELEMSHFCSKHGFCIEEIGSVSFKISSNKMMEPFSNISKALNAAARRADLTGPFCYNGAELYCGVSKNEG